MTTELTKAAQQALHLEDRLEDMACVWSPSDNRDLVNNAAAELRRLRALTQRPAAQTLSHDETHDWSDRIAKLQRPASLPAPQQATPDSACKVCHGTGDAPLVTKGESLCKACYGTGETLPQATTEEIAQVTGYTIPTPDDSFTAITYQTNDIGFFVDATEAARKQKALFFVNGFHDSVFGQSTPGWSYTQTRRVDENTVDIGRVVAFADEKDTPEPIPMVLHCPKCGMQHIDAPESGDVDDGHVTSHGWDNPPHRSHLCHGCDTIWRPADVPTTGVKAIATKGKADTWVPGQAAATPEPLIRFCPGCGSVGDVPNSFRDCCPDGFKARLIPASLAHHCHDLFTPATDASKNAATPEPVPAEQAKWCEYVAGMVDGWVSAEWSHYHHMDEGRRVKAIAGIIERRLWALQKQTAATPEQQAAGEPVGEVVWIQPNHLQMARVAPHLCRVAPTRIAPDFVPLSTHPAPGVPEVDFVGYVSPEALEELRMSGESASIHHWRAREDFVAVYVRRKPGALGAISELLAALDSILAAVSTNEGDSMGRLNSDDKVIWTVSSSWAADVRVTLGDLRKIALAAAQAKGGEHA